MPQVKGYIDYGSSCHSCIPHFRFSPAVYACSTHSLHGSPFVPPVQQHYQNYTQTGFSLSNPNLLQRVLDFLSTQSRVTNKIEWTSFFSIRLQPEGTVQSYCVILGSITQSKYLYGASREAYLPKIQVFHLLGPSLSLQGFPCRTLSSSPTKLDTPWSQLRLLSVKAVLFVYNFYERYPFRLSIILILYKGEYSYSGLGLTHVRATFPRHN